MLEQLQKVNDEVKVESIFDDSFKTYGKVVEDLPFDQLDDYMNNISEVPAEGNIYVASVPEMEKTELCSKLSQGFYGKMPIQIGFCNGNNSSLNGLEYHKGSEINYAVTDLVLLLANVWDIENNSLNVNKVKTFYAPKGSVFEMYGTTLHFAPCKTSEEGFKCVVVLPKGTNYPLQNKSEKVTAEDELLFMSNKWLIVHPDAENLVKNGAFAGIKGINLKVKI